MAKYQESMAADVEKKDQRLREKLERMAEEEA